MIQNKQYIVYWYKIQNLQYLIYQYNTEYITCNISTYNTEYMIYNISVYNTGEIIHNILLCNTEYIIYGHRSAVCPPPFWPYFSWFSQGNQRKIEQNTIPMVLFLYCNIEELAPPHIWSWKCFNGVVFVL